MFQNHGAHNLSKLVAVIENIIQLNNNEDRVGKDVYVSTRIVMLKSSGTFRFQVLG